jgi:hypothetical protein
MVPASLDTPSLDTEFDLDVRLQAVARDVSDERGEKPAPQDTDFSQCGQGTCTLYPA